MALPRRTIRTSLLEIEVIPIIREDVVLAKDSHVMARLVSKSTPYHNQFWLYQPEKKLLFDSIQGNVGKSFEVGDYPAGTRLVFALQARTELSITLTAASMGMANRMSSNCLWDPAKCQLRWEDLYDSQGQDYNDLVVEIAMTPR